MRSRRPRKTNGASAGTRSDEPVLVDLDGIVDRLPAAPQRAVRRARAVHAGRARGEAQRGPGEAHRVPDAGPGHGISVVGLDLREPADRQHREERRQAPEAVDEVRLAPAPPEPAGDLHDLGHSRPEPHVRRRAVRHQRGRGRTGRVREERDVVPASHEAPDEQIHHPLDPTLETRRHRQVRIGRHQDAHAGCAASPAAHARIRAPRSSGCSQCQRRCAACHDAVLARSRRRLSSAHRLKPAARLATSPGA